jgi:Tfp pilus assembly protein PilX
MKSIYLINAKYPNNRQRGVVLIVALVFLIALTAVAAALMQNTTTDIKMAGASQEKVMVTQETISEMERVINDGVDTGVFAKIIDAPIAFTVTEPLTMNATGINANQYGFDVSCPRSRNPTSGMKCSIKRLQVTQVYGRDNNNTIEVNSGISQQLLLGN